MSALVTEGRSVKRRAGHKKGQKSPTRKLCETVIQQHNGPSDCVLLMLLMLLMMLMMTT